MNILFHWKCSWWWLTLDDRSRNCFRKLRKGTGLIAGVDAGLFCLVNDWLLKILSEDGTQYSTKRWQGVLTVVGVVVLDLVILLGWPEMLHLHSSRNWHQVWLCFYKRLIVLKKILLKVSCWWLKFVLIELDPLELVKLLIGQELLQTHNR